MPGDHELIARIGLAGILGGLLGFEREIRGHDPGMRTHARVAAQVAAGIGFIGAGAVMRSGGSVRGLTTAASLWVSAAIGVAAGAAGYGPMAGATAVSLLILTGLRIAKPKLLKRFGPSHRTVQIEYERGHGTLGPAIRRLESINCRVSSLQLDDDDEDGGQGGRRQATIALRAPDDQQLIAVVNSIRRRPEVVDASIDPLPDGPEWPDAPDAPGAPDAAEPHPKHVEVELQYVYRGDDREVVPIELAGLRLERSKVLELHDSFFDDDELSLRRSRCSLRVREAGDRKPHLVWKGPSLRRSDGAKSRDETDIPLTAAPTSGAEIRRVLKLSGIWPLVQAAASLSDDVELRCVGQIRNRRSVHRYRSAQFDLELVWDRLAYPVGAPETRIEVEAMTAASVMLLQTADAQLRAAFGDRLEPVTRGKCRELCARLYPELVS